MTLQEIYALIYDNRLGLSLLMFLLPWLALGICVAVPGDREEPFVLNVNLFMAILSLSLSAGYVWYTTNAGGWNKVVQETDILLLLAPLYYVGVSLWISKQRLPLSEIRVYRAVQGVALIGAGYLGLSWIMSKIRILILTFMPFQVLVFLVLGLIGVAYLGYLRLVGSDAKPVNHSYAHASPRGRRQRRSEKSIDDELEELRRNLKK